MNPFTRHCGSAAPLRMINIDTDLIIPKQYLKNVTRKGLGTGLFSELRYLEDQTPNPRFVLNKPAFGTVSILVAGDNFGCGSSREHAQWALLDQGIVCIISTAFADIFHANCINNGILPACIAPTDLAHLFDIMEDEVPLHMTVDLETCQIHVAGGRQLDFKIGRGDRKRLLDGRDPISDTLSLHEEISTFQKRRSALHSWL